MSWIRTATGRHLDLTGSTAVDIDPLDLARGLARACRFAGQCDAFYSVAQHCVLASLHVPSEHALHALLHDAAEAYLGDLTGPLKRLLVSYHQALLASAAQVAGLTQTDFIEQLGHRLPLNWTVPYTRHAMALQADRPFYHQLEQHLMSLIAEHFGLSPEMPDSVKAIDLRLLATERRDLMPADDEPWECLAGIEPLSDRIEPWPADVAERRYLRRLLELMPPSPRGHAQKLVELPSAAHTVCSAAHPVRHTR
ncbi:hypothetical protein [Pseudomonas oryzihabitans]|uniref:hypothetical protein n=1 Tax=Pseudomonas oryzihabitans TaxID=47885 RepID=UPI00289572FB|nr:hypothetical protein [Pseudomonas oryzihabitans]MDT3722969.1 hypothetical protein [Pseudomonas oryzihabitans]